MGQVDIYPTLLELLGLERYYWKGLGQSILDPDKRAYAVSPLGQFVGNTREVPAAELKRSARCWSISVGIKNKKSDGTIFLLEMMIRSMVPSFKTGLPVNGSLGVHQSKSILRSDDFKSQCEIK